ncbi:MAG: hypothetical protein HZC41_09845 [Chloroflexi bacterium]|nr:hypothetical protein [Chloroflexota bacterium]
MDANSIRYRHRQSGDATIVVIPAHSHYVHQMERCHQMAYGYAPGNGDSEDMTADKYAHHLRVFPEGQFIALDTRTDTVVGVATSMRLHLPHHPSYLGTWAEITGDG